MPLEAVPDDQAAGLRRVFAHCKHIVVLGDGAATAGAGLALAQACTQAWGSVLVADPGAICLSLAGVQPLFSALDARAVTEAMGCRFLLAPPDASQAALARFAEQTGNRALLYFAAGDDVELPPAGAMLGLVVLGDESAPERTYSWLKALAGQGLLQRTEMLWLGEEASYLRLAEAAQRFLSYEIAGEICAPGADPVCAARALAARMRDGGQIWSRVRLHA